MSQYPPPPNLPPHIPYQPPFQPPGGVGPIGYSQLPPSSRTSAAAVTSLIFGILGCIPIVSGIVAIITGIIGLQTTKNPIYTGRGLATAGLVLGIMSLIGWTAFGIIAGVGWAMTGPERIAAKQFVTDLSKGDVAAIQAESNNLTKEQIQDGIDQMKKWGPAQNFTAIGVSINDTNGQTTGTVNVIFVAGGQAHTVIVHLSKQNDVWKVDSFTTQ